MTEIDKLRRRLLNVNKNVVEYKMTIIEAKSLLAEINVITEKSKEKPLKEAFPEPTTRVIIIDSGSL
jgi:hypothetical protein